MDNRYKKTGTQVSILMLSIGGITSIITGGAAAIRHTGFDF